MSDSYFKDPDGPFEPMEIEHLTKDELLDYYATKSVRRFLQIDAHGLCEEGAIIHSGAVCELRNTDNPVRAYIAEGTTKGEVLFYLSEIIKELKKEGHRLDEFGEGRRSG